LIDQSRLHQDIINHNQHAVQSRQSTAIVVATAAAAAATASTKMAAAVSGYRRYPSGRRGRWALSAVEEGSAKTAIGRGREGE